jgi:hypothetical protein
MKCAGSWSGARAHSIVAEIDGRHAGPLPEASFGQDLFGVNALFGKNLQSVRSSATLALSQAYEGKHGRPEFLGSGA